MKKETKKQLLVIVIALVMFFSSAAWIILGAAPVNSQQQSGQTQVPENLIVEGRLSDETATQLLQRGFSLMEWHYYTGCCPDLQLFVEALPGELENQIVVQKINDTQNETWASVRSLRGEQTWNISSVNDLLPPLCEILLKPPVECGLMQFENQSR
jgi:hypothetical protein